MKHYIFIVIILLFFTSCESYVSKYPISYSNDSFIISELNGNWQYHSHYQDTTDAWTASYNGSLLRIMAFNEHEHLIELIPDIIKTQREYLDDILIMRGFTTEIDGDIFINLMHLSSDDDTESLFTIQKIHLNKDTLFTSGISPKMFKSLNIEIESIADHYKFIKSIQNKKEYWDMGFKFVKFE